MKIGLYPGTFDPLTNGHLDIIVRSSTLCDKLIIAVAKNTSKNPFFSIDKRIDLINEALILNKIDTKSLVDIIDNSKKSYFIDCSNKDLSGVILAIKNSDFFVFKISRSFHWTTIR